MQNLFRSAIAQPIFQFFIIAAVLYTAIYMSGKLSGDEYNVNISDKVTNDLYSRYKSEYGLAPDEVTFRAYLDDWMQEEILFREAKAMGLDIGDDMIRERLVRKFKDVLLGEISTGGWDEKDLQNWFNEKIENTVNNSVNLARSYLADHYKLFINNVLLTANDINRNKKILIKNDQNFTKYITAQSKLRGLQNIYIINLDGDIKYQQLSNEKYKKPLEQYLANASNGKPFWYSNAFEKKTYGIVKLNSYNNLYLYVVKNVDNQIVSFLKDTGLSLIHISEPTRQAELS